MACETPEPTCSAPASRLSVSAGCGRRRPDGTSPQKPPSPWRERTSPHKPPSPWRERTSPQKPPSPWRERTSPHKPPSPWRERTSPQKPPSPWRERKEPGRGFVCIPARCNTMGPLRQAVAGPSDRSRRPRSGLIRIPREEEPRKGLNRQELQKKQPQSTYGSAGTTRLADPRRLALSSFGRRPPGDCPCVLAATSSTIC